MLGNAGWRRNLAASLCLTGLAGTMLTHADIGIGTQIISAGGTIKVVEPGPHLQDIIDGITDEGSGKPYVIELGPGVYDVLPDEDNNGCGLVMAEYVSVVGSGQGITILEGAFSDAFLSCKSAVVTGASHALLADLSVKNSGGPESYSVAILNDEAETRIERVTASATGGGLYNVGVRNLLSSSIMTTFTASASGGASINRGVMNSFSDPIMTQVVATATGAETNTAVSNSSSMPVMTEVIATAVGDEDNRGVSNSDSSPIMSKVTATALGGTNSYGVLNLDADSAPTIQRSILSGSTHAINFGTSAATRITNSQLIGGVDADALGTQCRNAFDEDLDDVVC